MTNKISGAGEFFLRSVQITPYCVTVNVLFPDGEEVKLTVFPDGFSLCEGQSISKEEFSELVESAERYAAYKKGIDLLAYGDCTKKRLVQKLRQRGYSSQSAIFTAAMLEKKGFIKEGEHALRCAEGEAKKKYGKKRIAARLFSLGFEQKYISEAMEYLEENVDFEELLEEYAEKHGLFEKLLSKDYSQRQKATASLINRGFTASEISSVLKNRR